MATCARRVELQVTDKVTDSIAISQGPALSLHGGGWHSARLLAAYPDVVQEDLVQIGEH